VQRRQIKQLTNKQNHNICLFALKPLIFKGFSVSVDNEVLYGAVFEPLFAPKRQNRQPCG